MPYRTYTLAGATPAAIAEELRLELDTALSAVPAWTKVTSAYSVSATWIFDVWQNSGAADGYGWFLVVGKHKTLPHCNLGGMLEYDAGTNIAKKALRGSNVANFVGADGYPTSSAGGPESTFALQAFTNTQTNSIGLLGAAGATPFTAPAAGNWVRTLVTDRSAWQGYGTLTALSYCHGVSTYQNLHSPTSDQKPLAFVAHTGNNIGGGSVWQHPAATDATKSRATLGWSTTPRWSGSAATQMFGEVGGLTEINSGGVIGARCLVARDVTVASKETMTTVEAAGGFLGIAPDDFLVFDRANAVQIGDTITVGGKIYVSVDTPATAGGLFINTQPAV